METATYKYDGLQVRLARLHWQDKSLPEQQNRVLRGDFVPAKWKSDSVYNFYDLVLGNFYSSMMPMPFKEA